MIIAVSYTFFLTYINNVLVFDNLSNVTWERHIIGMRLYPRGSYNSAICFQCVRRTYRHVCVTRQNIQIEFRVWFVFSTVRNFVRPSRPRCENKHFFSGAKLSRAVRPLHSPLTSTPCPKHNFTANIYVYAYIYIYIYIYICVYKYYQVGIHAYCPHVCHIAWNRDHNASIFGLLAST